MPPFVAPAITNMAMIEGMPIKQKSCFTCLPCHGYYNYYLLGIKSEWMEMDHDLICIKAKMKGFNKILEINENNEGDFIVIKHICE